MEWGRCVLVWTSVLQVHRKIWPIFFGLELAQMKILLRYWHLAIKTYIIIFFFHLLLKNLTSQSKCLEKRRFCEFIPLDMYERFSFYHFWIPQGIPFSENIMFYPGTLGWNYCHFGGGWSKVHTVESKKINPNDFIAFI